MTDNLAELTATIVASFVESNKIAGADLPALIKSVYGALSGVGQPAEDQPETVAKPTAAQIRKSITPDGIVNFEDGKIYKSMRRTLALQGLTPAAYREKWGLPKGYPIVAPNYSATRSAMAKSIGLGAKGRKAAPEPAPVKAPVKAGKAPRAKRQRVIL
jgi:predicted transcriptional regulator